MPSRLSLHQLYPFTLRNAHQVFAAVEHARVGRLGQRLELGGVRVAKHDGKHGHVQAQAFVFPQEVLGVPAGHAVREQNDGRRIFAQIILFQLPQAFQRCRVNIGTAPSLFLFYAGIQRFQLRAVALRPVYRARISLKRNQNVDLLLRSLQEVGAGVFLQQDLRHGLHHLRAPLAQHAARIIQAVHRERRLAELGLVEVQAFEQHVRGRHVDGREHALGLHAPLAAEHVQVFLRNALVAGAAARALNLVLHFVREQVFLQLEEGFFLAAVPVVHIAQRRIRQR